MKGVFIRNNIINILVCLQYITIVIVLYLQRSSPYQLNYVPRGRSGHAGDLPDLHVNHSIIILLTLLFVMLLISAFLNIKFHPGVNRQLTLLVFTSLLFLVFLSFQKPDLLGNNISGFRNVKGVNFIGALILTLPIVAIFFFVIKVKWNENKFFKTLVMTVLPICLFYFCLINTLSNFYLLTQGEYEIIFHDLGGRG